MSIANDAIIMQVLKDFNARAVRRNTLSVIILKIGRKLYPFDPLDSPSIASWNLKKILLENHAESKFRPKFDDTNGEHTRVEVVPKRAIQGSKGRWSCC